MEYSSLQSSNDSINTIYVDNNEIGNQIPVAWALDIVAYGTTIEFRGSRQHKKIAEQNRWVNVCVSVSRPVRSRLVRSELIGTGQREMAIDLVARRVEQLHLFR